MPNSFLLDIHKNTELSAEPRRSKRRLSALIEDADDPQSPPKRSRRSPQRKRRTPALEDDVHNQQASCERHKQKAIFEWLETVPRKRRSSGINLSRPTVALPRRSDSVPVMRPERSFATPGAPASSTSKSVAQSTEAERSQASSKATSFASQVQAPDYRRHNLEMNSVVLRTPTEPLPAIFEPILERLHAKRGSPEPDVRSWTKKLTALAMGTDEPFVEKFYQDFGVFPEERGPTFRSDRKLIFRDGLPQDVEIAYRISQPVPDMLYGYDKKAFTRPQYRVLGHLGRKAEANTVGSLLPFSVNEVKADGPHGSGSLWVATNQCMGGVAACAKLAADLYQSLSISPDPEVKQYTSVVFSTATTGSEGRLYIAWVEDETTYMQLIEDYLLRRPAELLLFRSHQRNIIDWGNEVRFPALQDLLDKHISSKEIVKSVQAKPRRPSLASSQSASERGSERGSKRGRSEDGASTTSSNWEWHAGTKRQYRDAHGVRIWDFS
jgi:hypothetical protein